jgi:hypothetical protein
VHNVSSKNGLGKLYDRLTPEERFRLDVEAMARGDAEESRRLVDTCPRRTYAMTDLAFSGRWQTTSEMVLALCVDLSQHMSRLSMIDAIRETLPFARVVYQNAADGAYLKGHEKGSRYAWEHAGMAGDPPGWQPLEDEEAEVEGFDAAIDEDLDELSTRLEETDIMPELLTRLERKTTGQAWTLWEAFAGFCETWLDVEAEKLIQARFEIVLSGVEDLKARKERLEVKADEEGVSEIRGALVETWEQHLGEVKRLS